MKSAEEIRAACAAQEKLTAELKVPHFAPYNGICWACHQQIYELESGTSFVTGCPHCHRSYCD